MRIRIYTDGACSNNPGIGGWAFALFNEEEVTYMYGGQLNTTNNRMEMFAVLKGIRYVLKMLKEKQLEERIEIEILSDSAYVVNAVNNSWLQSWKNRGWKTKDNEEVKNKDLWQIFSKYQNIIAANNMKLIMTKVKGHSGNAMNEKVDELAKKAINELRCEDE